MNIPDAPPPYDTVVFDCDSTLSAVEGIKEMAGARHAAEVEQLTTQAMDGDVPLEEVYGRRLALIRPSLDEVEAVGRLYVERLVTGVEPLLAALRELKKRVAVVSGGVLPAVAVLAEHLGLAAADVYAVGMRFAADGSYAGFDEDSPLARAGGKIDVVGAIAAESSGPVALVGDGATDIEAAGEVARFVAFGGVARRAAVFAQARVSCEAPDFAGLVPLLLSPGEIDLLGSRPRHAPLLEAARRLS